MHLKAGAPHNPILTLIMLDLSFRILHRVVGIVKVGWFFLEINQIQPFLLLDWVKVIFTVRGLFIKIENIVEKQEVVICVLGDINYDTALHSNSNKLWLKEESFLEILCLVTLFLSLTQMNLKFFSCSSSEAAETRKLWMKRVYQMNASILSNWCLQCSYIKYCFEGRGCNM